MPNNLGEHTPTPWKLTYLKPGRIAIHGKGGLYTVAIIEAYDINRMINAEDEVNAAFIVKACNSHEKMREALQKIADGCRVTTWQGQMARAALKDS